MHVSTSRRPDPSRLAPGRPPKFTCECHRGSNGTVWVRPVGELDIASAEQFDQAVCAGQAAAEVTIIDLRGLEFIDSFGLSRLLAAAARGRSSGIHVVFIRGRPSIQRVLALTQIDARLTMVNESDPDAGGLIESIA